jgi:protein CpxP
MRSFHGMAVVALLWAGILASQAFGQGGMRMSAEDRTKQLKDSLSLTTAQADSILKIFKDVDHQRQEMMSSGSGYRQARMEAMRSLMEKADTKIEALLTPDQKAKYEEIKKARQARMQEFRRREN